MERRVRVFAALTVEPRESTVLTCAASLPAEMDEDPAEVVGVLLDAVVEGLDLLLVQKAQNVLLQCSGTLPWDDLHQGRLLGDRFVDDGAKCPVYLRFSFIEAFSSPFTRSTSDRNGTSSDTCRHTTHPWARNLDVFGHVPAYDPPQCTLTGNLQGVSRFLQGLSGFLGRR
jgi:hypothetical protein